MRLPQLPQNPWSRAVSGIAGTGCLLPTAPLCIRAFWPARFGFAHGSHYSSSQGNAPVVMGRLVMKFGGTSVANIDRIRNVARHVKREVDAGHDVAVVVSAMAATELITRFKERKEVAVVAGFQGINPQSGRITTLGRGGSDTSAVAIAAAIHAARCDIYTDVDGVYTTDPRVVPKARRLDKITFEDMLELASQGAKVLQVRSVELGMVHGLPVFVRSSFDRPEDIDPYATPPGTLICSEEEIMENHVVTGIAFSKDEAQISVRQIEDKPGVAASIFGPLAEANINVDMIVQNVSEDGKTTDLTFTVPASDYVRARDTITAAKKKIGYARLDSATDVAKVSVIGSGMRSHAGVAAQAFSALAARNINIRAITTSEIKFSVLIDAAYTELAVRTLHTLYGLDQA